MAKTILPAALLRVSDRALQDLAGDPSGGGVLLCLDETFALARGEVVENAEGQRHDQGPPVSSPLVPTTLILPGRCSRRTAHLGTTSSGVIASNGKIINKILKHCGLWEETLQMAPPRQAGYTKGPGIYIISYNFVATIEKHPIPTELKPENSPKERSLPCLPFIFLVKKIKKLLTYLNG